MKTLGEASVIRKDIYSLKVWNKLYDNWEHVAMATSRAKVEKAKARYAGFFAISHPRQHAVDLYLAHGNIIH